MLFDGLPKTVLTDQNDSATATQVDEVVFGLQGDDVLSSTGNPAFLVGGSGNDTYRPDYSGFTIISDLSGASDTFVDPVSAPGNSSDYRFLRITESGSTQQHLAIVNPAGQGVLLLNAIGTNTDSFINNIVVGDVLSTILIGNPAVGTTLSFADFLHAAGILSTTFNPYNSGSTTLANAFGANAAAFSELFSDLNSAAADLEASGAGSEDEHIIGTELSDNIHAGDGDDIVEGRGADDTLYGERGNDTLNGGTGHDKLFGGTDNDTLIGGDGHDMLYGGLGADDHQGGDGFDYARYNDANYGDITVSLLDPSQNSGAAAGDTFSDIEGLIMGNANDTAIGDHANNYIYGMKGNDRLFGEGGTDHVFGGAGKDDLFGGAGDDFLFGDSGGDKIYGGAGADYIDGGDGFDYVRFDDANHGNVNASLANQALNTSVAAGDTYVGIEGLVMGAGHDRAYGDSGNNYLYGFGGNDMLYGGLGVDYIHGGTGLDYARYDDANYGDLFVSLLNPALNTGAAAGDQFVDIEGLVTGAGNDTGYGNSAANYMFGMAGNDVLVGQAGNDRLNGGLGNDRLVGGANNDRLTGGADADVFVFRANYALDEIWDYSGVGLGGGEGDRIDLRGVFADFGAVDLASQQAGSNVEITVNGSDILTILNYQKTDLIDGDFIF